ncbi:hypothetical protein FB567DRAFT_551769 [Paraphoma chrysanthemicola]|uniref:J domain-containing protein n=1 Tax=Paraphoma chrysanthemicola TaxID=798071 RepID=A0A8K0QZE1_9PLEO|nr:hypothetical protein FB567DRAFT_551769 [Paraphoma chrysanthemicola]
MPSAFDVVPWFALTVSFLVFTFVVLQAVARVLHAIENTQETSEEGKTRCVPDLDDQHQQRPEPKPQHRQNQHTPKPKQQQHRQKLAPRPIPLMMRPVEPSQPDHYSELGLTEHATLAEIKKAFHKLALLHHPDKKVPGAVNDAAEFLKVRAAFDVLKDPTTRYTYDLSYAFIKSAWQKYRADLARFRRTGEAERQGADGYGLEAERERKRKESEAAANWEACRKSHEAERKVEEARRKAEEAQRQADELFRRAEARLQRERIATERTHQAAERANKNKSRQLNEDSIAAERARAEHAEKAHQRLAAWEAEEKAQRGAEPTSASKTRKHELPLQDVDWISARGRAAKKRSRGTTRSKRSCTEKSTRIRAANRWAEIFHNKHAEELRANGSVLKHEGDYVELGWMKKRGVAVCDFCDTTVKFFSFTCPSGEAVACDWCKNKMSFYMAPLPGTGVAVGMTEDVARDVFGPGRIYSEAELLDLVVQIWVNHNGQHLRNTFETDMHSRVVTPKWDFRI